MDPRGDVLTPKLPWTGERCVPDAMSADYRILLEHVARYRWVRDRMEHLLPHRIVLDAPCGAGYGTAILANSANAAIALGVDIDEPTILYARQRYGIPGRMLFRVGDLVELRTRADVVVCFEGIEHVIDQERAAAALCGALKRGGLLLVSTPRAGGTGAGSPYHTHELTQDELIALFAPHLGRYSLLGQDLDVGDADPSVARYLILEGTGRA